MTDTEVCSKLLIGWIIEKDQSKIDQLDNDVKGEFAIKVIEKKLEWAGLDIKLHPFLKALLVVCSSNNPGMVQLILSDILRSIRSRGIKITPGYEITPDDFSRAFPDEFPTISVLHINKKFEEKWDAQKMSSIMGGPYREWWEPDNKVDTRKWWSDLVK